jgi:hypothetical protein
MLSASKPPSSAIASAACSTRSLLKGVRGVAVLGVRLAIDTGLDKLTAYV